MHLNYGRILAPNWMSDFFCQFSGILTVGLTGLHPKGGPARIFFHLFFPNHWLQARLWTPPPTPDMELRPAKLGWAEKILGTDRPNFCQKGSNLAKNG